MSLGLPKEKHCKKCNTTKPSEAFSISKSRYKEKIYYTLQYACKPCVVERSKQQVSEPRYIRPSRKKVINENSEIKMMQSPMAWEFHKKGVQVSESKIYPTCSEGHRYVGKQCLPCKYGVIANSMA